MKLDGRGPAPSDLQDMGRWAVDSTRGNFLLCVCGQRLTAFGRNWCKAVQ